MKLALECSILPEAVSVMYLKHTMSSQLCISNHSITSYPKLQVQPMMVPAFGIKTARLPKMLHCSFALLKSVFYLLRVLFFNSSMLIPKLFHSLPAISVLLLTLILTPRPAWAECWLITDRTGVNRKALCGHNRPPFEYLPMNLNASIVLLNVTGNHLQRLDPKALGRYPVLRRLDLTYNLLSSLPEAAFSALPDLRILLLGHNQLAHLPGDTFRGLSHLEILGLEVRLQT
uniref:Uncharacterized protein n=1 Tax=Eptatretus burgeri TaxID=7764 RepID=A0A8C4NBH9_EPTBU